MKHNFFYPTLFALIVLFLASSNLWAKDKAYDKTLKKWTRTDSVYRSNDLRAEIIWNATFLNHTMIAAMADYRARVYNLPDPEKMQVESDLLVKKNNDLLMFVSFYSPDRKTDDLMDVNNAWDLRLEQDGKIFRPVKIEKIKKIDPMNQFYFPYLSQWFKGYYVWFSTPNTEGPLKITVHGTNAHSELKW